VFDVPANNQPVPSSYLPDVRLLLTTAQAAERLGLSRATIQRLLASGELASVHVGRAHRIPVTDLERFVERLRNGQLVLDGASHHPQSRTAR